MQTLLFSESLKKLGAYIKAYNATQSSLKSQVRQPMISTARELVLLYGHFLCQTEKLVQHDIHALPPLRTNNGQLAARCQCSKRTIQRHMERLIDSGVVINKKWRGSNASYELSLSPGVLSINPYALAKSTENESEKSGLAEKPASEKTPTCPHIDSGYIKNNNKVNPEENLPKTPIPTPESQPETSGNIAGNTLNRRPLGRTNVFKPSGNTFTGYTGEKGEKNCGEEKKGKEAGRHVDNCFENVNKNFSNVDSEFSNVHNTHKQANNTEFDVNQQAGGKPAHFGTGEKGGAASYGQQISRFLRTIENRRSAAYREPSPRSLDYADQFWEAAQMMLYAKHPLTVWQLNEGKRLTQSLYGHVPLDKLKAYHESLMERLGMVAAYIGRDPINRFVQLPHQFFDIENTNGFAGTAVWWERWQQRKLKTQVRKAVVKAVAALRKHKAQNKPGLLEEYQQQEQAIRKFGPKAVEQFYTAVGQIGQEWRLMLFHDNPKRYYEQNC